MKKINACCLKLFLDKINNYEEGIVDIVKSIMDLNILFWFERTNTNEFYIKIHWT